MIRSSTPFHLGEAISGEPHLYVANPSAPPLEHPALETDLPRPLPSNYFQRFAVAIWRRVSLGPTPEDALTTALGKAFWR